MRVYNMHGQTVRTSQNLRGLLTHYRAKPHDVVVKVLGLANTGSDGLYPVTFYWPDGDHAVTHWADWRVLLRWLDARRSWSVARVTFDAPLYDAIEAKEPERFAAFRRRGHTLTRHAYAA